MSLFEKTADALVYYFVPFVSSARRAKRRNADVILLTCSAFNEARDLIQPLTKIPVLRSDEGVMKQRPHIKE
ncbi:hypothetical protein [Sinobaca sp. H24]|uniref:hypothetical protein n=1 Tax=Sinobaca sp. H24 TaxID=2923376 RepID=UPI00207A3FCD|nr:hypothetical protein [Sinobaca sp. H24]